MFLKKSEKCSSRKKVQDSAWEKQRKRQNKNKGNTKQQQELCVCARTRACTHACWRTKSISEGRAPRSYHLSFPAQTEREQLCDLLSRFPPCVCRLIIPFPLFLCLLVLALPSFHRRTHRQIKWNGMKGRAWWSNTYKLSGPRFPHFISCLWLGQSYPATAVMVLRLARNVEFRFWIFKEAQRPTGASKQPNHCPPLLVAPRGM